MKQTRIFSIVALMALLCLPGLSRAQQTLTVYNGTAASDNVPAYIFYWDDFTKSQFVIPAADLTAMNGGTISALTFYTNDNNVPYTSVSTVDVYLKELTSTTLSSFIAKSSATVFYSGTVDIVAAGTGGTMTITFSTPYTYNGGNLLIGIENTTDAGYKHIYFYGQTVTGASGAGSDPNSLDDVTFTQQNFAPKTTFTYSSGGSTPDGIVIGDPNTTASYNTVPVNTYYNYSLTETIIDASELGGAMTIESISYKYAHTTPTTSSDYGIKIWIKPTSKTHFTSESDIETLDNTAVLVYDGPFACSQGWNEITFTTPYNYSGSGNLMVIVRDTVDGYDGQAFKFYASSCAGNKTLDWYSDYVTPDPTSTSYNGTKSTYAYRPLMVLGVGGGSTPDGVVIGDPASTSTTYYTPVSTFFNYSLTETIINASEIGGSMTIGSISYKYAYTTPMTSSKYGVKIWLKPTNKTQFSSNTDMEPVDNTATLVYDGSFACSQGWNEVTFTTPYNYSGTGNLMVIVCDTVLGYDGTSYTFNTSSCSGNMTLAWRSDTYIPDPSSTSTTNSGTSSTFTYRPLMVLGGTSSNPPEPLTVTLAGPTSGAANTALTFTATGPGDASYTWYTEDYFYRSSGMSIDVIWRVGGTYKVRVTATRGSESVSDSLMVTISRRAPETTINSTAQWYAANTNDFNKPLGHRFIKFTMQQPEQAQSISDSGAAFTADAAEYANGNVYVYKDSYGKLFRQTFDATNPSIGTMTEVGTVSYLIRDMSYNIVDNTMYGIIKNGDQSWLVSIDLSTGGLTHIGNESPVSMFAFAINATGDAYSIGADGNLYSVNLTNGTFTLVGATGHSVFYVQSMAFDRATGELFWAQYVGGSGSTPDPCGLYKVNTTTGHTDFVGYIRNQKTELCGLFNTSMPGPNGVSVSDPATPVSIYPNPATDVVTVRAEALREVSLLDLNGRVLSTTAGSRIDVSGLAAGVYFLRVVTADGVAMEKLVKE